MMLFYFYALFVYPDFLFDEFILSQFEQASQPHPFYRLVAVCTLSALNLSS